jgi:integrase
MMASITPTTTKSGERRYVVRYRDPTGKSKEKWYRRKVDAGRFANAIEADMSRGQYLDPNAGRINFATLADTWLATRIDKAPSTQKRDRSYLDSMILPIFGNRPVKSITPSEVEAWLASLDRSPNTRGKALQILRSVLDLARRDRLIAVNSAADVTPPTMKPQRVRTVLNDDQVEQLIAAAEDFDERTAVVVHLMARCGLRIGEALALRRKDVDLDNALLHIRTSMTRSGPVRPVKGRHREDEGRVVPIPDDVARRLRRHFTERPITGIDNFVVTAPRGGPLRYSNWRSRVWVKITERVDYNVTPHDLRRTAATRLFVKDRWTPAEVQAFLGHRDPRITLAIYTLVEAKDLPRPSTLNTRSN